LLRRDALRLLRVLYLAIKFLHILLAIVAVGFNASYGVWLARSEGKPELGSVLRGIKILDDRFANPAYGLLLLTGLAMVVVGRLPLTTLWIDLGLALWLVLMIAGFALYTPSLREQIRLAEAGQGDSVEYAAVSRRGRIVGIALGVVALAIVADMVLKPTL
jgi:uncharacterized membrane protein